jgi:hypothetical protein
MSLKRSELFARWGDLQHAQDRDVDAPGWADRDHAIGLARGAYLDAVHFGAVEEAGKPPTREVSAGARGAGWRMPRSGPSSFTIR